LLKCNSIDRYGNVILNTYGLKATHFEYYLRDIFIVLFWLVLDKFWNRIKFW